MTVAPIDSSNPYAAPKLDPSADARFSGGERPWNHDAATPTHPIILGYVAWCFGFFGAHRFYFGKPISGVLYLLTLGFLGIGWLLDVVLIPDMAQQAGRRYTVGHTDYTIGWLLLTFLGVFGVHRFYLGKWGTGLIYLVSGGLLGIGVIYDALTLNEQIDRINRQRIG